MYEIFGSYNLRWQFVGNSNDVQLTLSTKRNFVQFFTNANWGLLIAINMVSNFVNSQFYNQLIVYFVISIINHIEVWLSNMRKSISLHLWQYCTCNTIDQKSNWRYGDLVMMVCFAIKVRSTQPINSVDLFTR